MGNFFVNYQATDKEAHLMKCERIRELREDGDYSQKQIADYLDKKCADIDSLISIKQQKIEELKEYKKSLIYEYVTGKKEVI